VIQLTRFNRVRLETAQLNIEKWLETRYNPEIDLAPRGAADKYDVAVLATQLDEVISIILMSSVTDDVDEHDHSHEDGSYGDQR